MIDLLVEGLRASWQPCTLVVLAPGVLVTAGRPSPDATAGYVVAVWAIATLRFGGTIGEIPDAVAGAAWIGAALLLVAAPGRRGGLAGPVAAIGAAALWEPCVGTAFGALLSDWGPASPVPFLAYTAALATPLAVVVGGRLAAPPIGDRGERVLRIGAAAVLALLGAAAVVGLADDVIGRLLAWSSA